MCVDEAVKEHNGNGGSRRDAPAAQGLRVDLIDSWHKRWPLVLSDIDRIGRRNVLMLDPDGWLSARQCVLVAFDDERVAGHLVFRIEPAISQHLDEKSARRVVEAKLDDFGVRAGADPTKVRDMLLDAANRYATSLRCYRQVGFDRI